MIRRFRLANVLRARQAQEDAARGAVLRARADAARAADQQASVEHALSERDVPDEAQSLAFVAAQAARQALAAEISAATLATASAHARVDDRMGQLTTAAVRRRTVEKLAERHADDVRKADARAGQHQLDELAGARRGNPGGGEQ
jgi:flagellar protein FliJ